MKKLLLTVALCALAVPAYATVTITSGCDPSGSFCFGAPGPSSPDSDDVKMFNNGALKDVDHLFGSTTGNGSHSTDSVLIQTGPIIGGVGPLVTTGNGFANIKAEDSTLTSITWTPQKGFTFDGFWTRAQMEFTQPDSSCKKNHDCIAPPASTNVFLQVNGGPIFQFAEALPESNDFAYIGFDEPQICVGKKCTDDESKAALITSVTMWVTDPHVSFFEDKQTMWSPCALGGGCSTVVINPTGGVPEIPTWAMGTIGFGLFGLGGLYRTRKPRYAIS